MRFVDPIRVFYGATKNELAEGMGYLWVVGDTVYEGQFSNNKLNGEGTMTFADGTELTGTWTDDVFEDGVNYWEKLSNSSSR